MLAIARAEGPPDCCDGCAVDAIGLLENHEDVEEITLGGLVVTRVNWRQLLVAMRVGSICFTARRWLGWFGGALGARGGRWPRQLDREVPRFTLMPESADLSSSKGSCRGTDNGPGFCFPCCRRRCSREHSSGRLDLLPTRNAPCLVIVLIPLCLALPPKTRSHRSGRRNWTF